MKQLILASQSPGRKLLLEKTGIDFLVVPSNYQEDMTLDMPPAELAKFLSQGKAREVASSYKNSVILAADSFAVHKDELLGKPHTLERAKQMLISLSGTEHSFVTGFTIIDTDSLEAYSEAVETRVFFRLLSPAEIDSYLAKENVLGKAGAYCIQDLGSIFEERIDGSSTNVQGLPMAQVAVALKRFGIGFI